MATNYDVQAHLADGEAVFERPGDGSEGHRLAGTTQLKRSMGTDGT